MTIGIYAIPDGMWGPYLNAPQPDSIISHLLEHLVDVTLLEQHHSALAHRMAGAGFAWSGKSHTPLPGSTVPVRALHALGKVEIAEYMPVARLAIVAALGQLLRDLRDAPQYVGPDDMDLMKEAEAVFMANCRPCPREAARAEEKSRLYVVLADTIEALV